MIEVTLTVVEEKWKPRGKSATGFGMMTLTDVTTIKELVTMDGNHPLPVENALVSRDGKPIGHMEIVHDED